MIFNPLVLAPLACTLSFACTYFLVPFLCDLAFRLHFVDIPDGRIKVHTKTTPYFGGVAVYIGFIVSLFLALPLEYSFFSLLIGASLLLLIGLLDDLITMKPYQKFVAQLVVITAVYMRAGLYLQTTILPYWTTLPLSFLWLATVINAFNLVDVMDGLATTLAACATLSFLVIAVMQGNYTLVLALSAFFGALGAFFIYNKPVAKIYLGDAGSLFIGGFLGGVPFLLSWDAQAWHGLFAPGIILAIPLLEVVSLVIIRTYKGIPFYHGSKDHFCLYLRAQNWTIMGILGYVATLSLYLGAWACLATLGLVSFPVLCAFMGVFLIIWTTVLMGKVRFW